jgi:hypothetical protein
LVPVPGVRFTSAAITTPVYEVVILNDLLVTELLLQFAFQKMPCW